MGQSELESKVLTIVKGKVSDADKGNTSLDSRFKEDLNLDSLDATELLMELEDGQIVDHKIPDGVAETFYSGRAVVEYASDPAAYVKKYNIQPDAKKS